MRVTLSILGLLATVALLPAGASAQDLTACRLKGIEREVRCGSLQVPENPDAPDGRKLTIRYAVVPAIARLKAPDPVFVLAGGPGQSATKVAGTTMPLFRQLNATRDIVFVDQRGTGGSGALECPRPAPAAPLAQMFDLGQFRQRLADCLKQQTADLAQYATWIAMRDLDAVRGALGAERINLWGGSYGTRAALEYLRQFPQRVRTVVLDGVAPADMVLPASMAVDAEAALQAVIARCAQDATCRQRYPDVGAALDRLLERAARGELRFEAAHPVSGRREPVRVDAVALASLLRGPLYVPQFAAVLPYALAEATRGAPDALVGLSTALAGSLESNFAEAMHFAVICADDGPRIDAAAREAARRTRFGAAFTDLYVDMCATVPTRSAPSGFYEVPKSAAPVLILSGGADPVTPPRHGEHVAKRLGNALHLVAPHVGHGVSLQGCAPEQITRFVRSAALDGLDRDCLARLPAPTFFQMPGTAGVAP